MPFSIARGLRTSLVAQVATGLRQAIATGFYKPGATLPNLLDMAERLKVSEIVTRHAVRQLTREGLLNPRRGTGIVVCSQQDKPLQGHILYISRDGFTVYYLNRVAERLMQRLYSRRYHLSSTFVPNIYQGRPDWSYLRIALGQPVSLAVTAHGTTPEMIRLLTEAEIPFIQFWPKEPSPMARASVRMDTEKTEAALCNHLLACHVRTVLQVRSDTLVMTLNMKQRLEAVGIRVKEQIVEPTPNVARPEAFTRGALDSFLNWLKGNPPLPDLIYVNDDWLAMGVLTALSFSGIRIPKDVQLITWSNQGLGPVFPLPLTRLEMNPLEHGDVLADCVLAALDGRPANALIAPRLVLGASTRAITKREKRRE